METLTESWLLLCTELRDENNVYSQVNYNKTCNSLRV